MTDENEEAYAALLDLESALTDLADTPSWQALEAAARQSMDEKRRRLLGGEMASHEDYLKLSWQLRGAEWVLSGILAETRQIIGELRRQTAEVERGKEQA